MEIRRIQQTGGSSFIITLPKEWIKLNKINKNDQLGLFSKSDGTLLITPKMISKKPSKLMLNCLVLQGIKNEHKSRRHRTWVHGFCAC